MEIDQRIQAFNALGIFLNGLSENEFQSLADHARHENPWFTEQNVRMALHGVQEFLAADKLQAWTLNYPRIQRPRTVALVMAGNIPLVGFHDLLAVLITGHKALVKLSSKDSILIKFITNELFEIEPSFKAHITFTEQLKNFDAVIATGSDNSSRYFDYYFGKYPHIIRKNRTSVAILDGTESDDALKALGADIFSYFGLGCRNVSKIFMPRGYSIDKFFQNQEPYANIIHHHKYNNNYDYQKSILLVNSVPFLDNGFLILQESEKMVSPISVLFYEYYDDQQALVEKIAAAENKIQCIVGHTPPATIPFGKAQFPTLSDYADRIDTLQFLTSL